MRQSLPLLAAACAHVSVDSELVVVDNGSDDDTAQVIADSGFRYRLLRLERNEGYSVACNMGVEAASHERVLLFNNDVLVTEDFLAPLLTWPLDRVFAVGSRIVPAGSPLPPPQRYARRQIGVPSHCCLLLRSAFLSLGRFDLLFSPAMWEEMDLGVRAWQAGRVVLVDYRSRVYHLTRATVKRLYSYHETERLYHRNRLLFLWKHLRAAALARHLLHGLPRDAASDVMVRGGPVMGPAIRAALTQLPRVVAARRGAAGQAPLEALAARTDDAHLWESWL